MTERPILFNAPMVRAVLAGSKMQTRRVAKPQPTQHHWEASPGYELRHSHMLTTEGRFAVKWWHTIPHNRTWDEASRYIGCPYGQPGDRLWVREAWRFEGTDMMRHGRTHSTQDGVVSYLADGKRLTINTEWRNVETWMARKHQNRPGIHMPRWASRITLEVTGVRVERLQDISEADTVAEGIPSSEVSPPDMGRFAYRQLWESINGPGSWEANPWVWVVEFRRI